MILFPFLIFMSGFVILLSVHHLNQTLVSYYDFVALLMVLGGTLSVGILILPWEYRNDIKKTFKFLLRPESRKFHQLISESLEILQSEGRSKKTNLFKSSKYVYSQILEDGLDLVQLNFSPEKIEMILSERIHHHIKRLKRIATAIRSLSKYPPAFGLMGTVLGLVNIMKHLANSAEASQLGTQMSVALVSTMYGLLVSNFFVQPMGELFLKKSEEEEEYAFMALQTILLLRQRASILESVEVLNSMVPEEQRVKLDEEFLTEQTDPEKRVA